MLQYFANLILDLAKKAMDERHAQELFLQTKMYKCLLRCTVIMEKNWLEKKE